MKILISLLSLASVTLTGTAQNQKPANIQEKVVRIIDHCVELAERRTKERDSIYILMVAYRYVALKYEPKLKISNQ